MKYSQALVIGSLLSAAFIAEAVRADTLTPWETLAPNEEEDARTVSKELIKQINSDTVNKGKRAFRDAHPRGIGCVAATFTIDANLPEKYRTNLFSQPGKSYDSLIRFSGSLGPAGDNVNDARGMAIKLFGVSGTKLLSDQPSATTQDFLQINAPTFPARDSREFAGLVGIKSNPTSAVRFILGNPILRALEIKQLLASSIGNPFNGKSLAEQQFFSEVPYLFNSAGVNTPVKFSTRPCGPVDSLPLDGTGSELRNDLQARLNKGSLCYEFLYQFYQDGAGLIVEDGMNEWTEQQAPFVRFATITIPSQTFLTDEKLEYCDNLSMQPWHTTAEHRPIGNINRTRKIVYETISDYRHSINQAMAARQEPTDLTDWNKLQSTTYSSWDSVLIPAVR